MWVGLGNAAGRMLGYRQRPLCACRGEKGGEGVMPDGLFSPSAQRWVWEGAGVRRGWDDDPEGVSGCNSPAFLTCVECVGVGVRMSVGCVMYMVCVRMCGV